MLAKTIGGRYQIVNFWEKGNLVTLTLPKIGRSFGNPLCVVKQLKLKYNEPDALQINQRRRQHDRDLAIAPAGGACLVTCFHG